MADKTLRQGIMASSDRSSPSCVGDHREADSTCCPRSMTSSLEITTGRLMHLGNKGTITLDLARQSSLVNMKVATLEHKRYCSTNKVLRHSTPRTLLKQTKKYALSCTIVSHSPYTRTWHEVTRMVMSGTPTRANVPHSTKHYGEETRG